MNYRLYKQVELEDNTVVDFYDCSKKIAGDRYLVRLMIKMTIPITQALRGENKGDEANIAEIKKALGDSVVFEQVKERNFIDQKEKDRILDELYRSFENHALGYLQHPDFKKNYILKLFREHKEKSKWYN